MELKDVQVIDDPTGPEVDIFVSDKEKVEFVSNDPFTKVNVEKLHSRKLSRKYTTLKKRFEGQGAIVASYEDAEAMNGYALFDVVEPPYNIEALAQLYDDHAIHRACIDARVMNTVGLGNTWEQTLPAKRKTEKVSNKEKPKLAWRNQLLREAEDLAMLMDELNQEDTFQEVLIKAWTDALATGNGYIEIGRNNAGKIGYVGHIPAKYIRVRRQRDGFAQYATEKRAIFFRNFGDTTTPNPFGNDPTPNEILHLKMYSPTSNYYGVPPAVSAAPAILGDKYAKDFNLDYFENKAIPRYAIIIKGVKLSEKSKSELVNYFRNEVKGKNHGTLLIPLPVLAGSGKDTEIKFEKLEAEITDGSFDKYRKSNRDEIISAYRVPPTKVSIYDNANLAISRDADKTFKTQVVGPDQVLLEKRINRIVAEFSENLRFKFKQLDLVDDDIKSRIHDRYLRTKVISPNEVREEIEKPPVDGGDEMLVWAPEVKLLADKQQQQSGSTPAANDPGGQPANQNAATGAGDPTPTTSDANRQDRGAAQGTQARDRVAN